MSVTAAAAPAAAVPTRKPASRILLLMSSAQSWKAPALSIGKPMEKKSILSRYLPFVFNFLNATSDGALVDVFEDGFRYPPETVVGL